MQIWIFLNTKQICIFLRCRSEFFSNRKLICIFLRGRSIFFCSKKWFEFFLKFFSFFYKIADFEISKKKLRARLKSFLLICDACIVSLSHKCESSFKSFFIYLLYKNRSNFYQSNPFFFLPFTKIDLIFTNQIFLFTLYKNKFDFYKSNLSFYPLQKQIWFLPIKSHFFKLTKTIWFLSIKYFFLPFYKNRFDFY